MYDRRNVLYFSQLFGEADEDEDVSPDTADPELAADAGQQALHSSVITLHSCFLIKLTQRRTKVILTSEMTCVRFCGTDR